MTKKFDEAIHLLYEEYRNQHLKTLPRSNENDCERGFLQLVLGLTNHLVEESARDRIQALIDSIR